MKTDNWRKRFSEEKETSLHAHKKARSDPKMIHLHDQLLTRVLEGMVLNNVRQCGMLCGVPRSWRQVFTAIPLNLLLFNVNSAEIQLLVNMKKEKVTIFYIALESVCLLVYMSISSFL